MPFRDRFDDVGVSQPASHRTKRSDAMWSQRLQDVEEIEEAGASIMAGMRLLAEHLDPPTAHALATQLLDDLLRDMLKEGSHARH